MMNVLHPFKKCRDCRINDSTEEGIKLKISIQKTHSSSTRSRSLLVQSWAAGGPESFRKLGGWMALAQQGLASFPVCLSRRNARPDSRRRRLTSAAPHRTALRTFTSPWPPCVSRERDTRPPPLPAGVERTAARRMLCYPRSPAARRTHAAAGWGWEGLGPGRNTPST